MAGKDAAVREALACPCVAELRDGVCGPRFVEGELCSATVSWLLLTACRSVQLLRALVGGGEGPGLRFALPRAPCALSLPDLLLALLPEVPRLTPALWQSCMHAHPAHFEALAADAVAHEKMETA